MTVTAQDLRDQPNRLSPRRRRKQNDAGGMDYLESKTVPVGVLTELVEGDVYHWGSLMAGALMGSLPVAILYSFFVEHYVSSMTGAVKE